MTSRIIRNSYEFRNLRTDWERLQRLDNNVTYYSTYSYIYLWWEHFKEDKNIELFIIVVESEGVVVGIAPLYLKKSRKKLKFIKTLLFLGEGDFADFLIFSDQIKESNIYAEVFNVIEENKSSFVRTNLTNIKHNSTLAHFLFKSKYNSSFSYLMEAPYIDLNRFVSGDDYRKLFGPRNTKKLSNRLRREHNYRFICQEGINKKQIEIIKRLHIKEQEFLKTKLQRSERTSLFSDPRMMQFLSSFWNQNQDVVFFHLVDDNDHLIAYDLCYAHNNILHSWNMAYDPEYSSFSPGKIITYEITNYLIETDSIKIFDMGPGRYEWKFEWTNEFVLTYKLNILF